MRAATQRIRRLRIIILLIAAVTGAPGDAMRTQDADHELDEIAALAPVTVAASGLGHVSGLAVHRGDLLVTHRAEGTLSRVDAAGVAMVLLRDLQRPEGVAVGPAGDVFVLEAGLGRILRVDQAGETAVVIGGLDDPRAVAVDPAGDVWVASHAAGGFTVGRVEASGTLAVVISGLPDVTALAATEDGVIVGAPNAVLRVPAGGGPPDTVVPRWRATAAAVDRHGDLYLSGRSLGSGDAGGIAKYHRDAGAVTRFAAPLRQAGPLALEPSGDLLAFSGRSGGRILRFTAPAPPLPHIPRYTNQLTLRVTGVADREARLQLFVDRDLRASTIASETTGEFTMDAALMPNASTTLVLVATAAGGAGLAGGAASATVVHDDRPPSVAFSAPAAATHARTSLDLAATAEDQGSGVERIRFLLDDAVVGEADAGRTEESLNARTAVDLMGTTEGAHTVTVAADDRAGNQSAAAQLVIVDRTAPETTLVDHPAAETAARQTTFAFEATDVHSAVIDYSWRLDAGEWSPYGRTTSVTIEQLDAGPHVFEVRARDLAGNEDATPARWAFRVQALTLAVVEPVGGSTVSTSTIWVRGEAHGTPPVVVSIPLPLAFQALAERMTAPAIAGRFAIQVPVMAGASEVTVTATDGTGASATETVSIQVNAEPASSPTVSATPAAGFAPHAVQFGVASLPAGVYTVDLESDGTADYSGPKPDGRPFVYSGPGVFVATISGTTGDGIATEWRAAVHVYERAALEVALRAAWNAMKDALRSGEPDVAASFVHSGRREVWRDEFVRIMDAGPVDADVFTDIDVLGFEGDRVECEMMRAIDGLMFSFPVTFAMDADGRWRLWQF